MRRMCLRIEECRRVQSSFVEHIAVARIVIVKIIHDVDRIHFSFVRPSSYVVGLSFCIEKNGIMYKSSDIFATAKILIPYLLFIAR